MQARGAQTGLAAMGWARVMSTAARAAVRRARGLVMIAATAAFMPTAGAAQSPPPDLATARAAWEKAPTDADSIIWYGRRVAYTGAFDEAVAIYTDGLTHHPADARLLRHRGHRYLSLRQYDLAIADLQRARELRAGRPDEVEPDGQPNARGIPTSTLHSNIRYHLALAHFLQGNFPEAEVIWEEDAKLAANLDQRVAATYWWVLSLARQRRGDEVQAALAPIRADWDIIENGSYHALLLWMKGAMPEDTLRAKMQSALELQTIGNGIAQWYLAIGRRASAEQLFRSVLETGPSASFGYLAAEAAARELGLR